MAKYDFYYIHTDRDFIATLELDNGELLNIKKGMVSDCIKIIKADKYKKIIENYQNLEFDDMLEFDLIERTDPEIVKKIIENMEDVPNNYKDLCNGAFISKNKIEELIKKGYYIIEKYNDSTDSDEWICFSDADDYLDKEFLEGLIIFKDPEMLDYVNIYIKENNDCINLFDKPYKNDKISIEDYIKHFAITTFPMFSVKILDVYTYYGKLHNRILEVIKYLSKYNKDDLLYEYFFYGKIKNKKNIIVELYKKEECEPLLDLATMMERNDSDDDEISYEFVKKYAERCEFEKSADSFFDVFEF